MEGKFMGKRSLKDLAIPQRNGIKAQVQTGPMQRKDGKRRKRPIWLSHELAISPKHRKRAQRKWKLGWTARDKYV